MNIPEDIAADPARQAEFEAGYYHVARSIVAKRLLYQG